MQLAVSMLGFGFEDIMISNTYGVLPELEGKRITEIAKEWKKSAFETYLEIVDKTNAKDQRPDVQIPKQRDHRKVTESSAVALHDGRLDRRRIPHSELRVLLFLSQIPDPRERQQDLSWKTPSTR
ncbi:MAG: hypothetical protein MZU97_08370 [Bacillus subtilis]|nr:hypothetical protein [Bacillus subtilis]